MINTIFAKKIKMTGVFTPEGNRMGATVLKVPLTTVKDLRTVDDHGYQAIRLEIKDKKALRIREIRTQEVLEAGSEVKLEEIFQPGDMVKITGTTKGKGFAGVVKRHNFKGGPRTHGQSDRERAPGSSGSTTTPGRVFPGTRRAGHMGTDTAALVGVKVLEVDAENRTLTIVGSVPGNGNNRGGLITITKQS